MKKPIFQGCCTAIITPFTPDGIDFIRLAKLFELQLSGGVSAIVVAGTTGECATLSLREYDRLLAFSARQLSGRVPLIAGIGGNDTAECLEKAKMAEAAGADAILMTTPYYNKTTQAGLTAHFTYVADRAALPLILYNVPGRTSIGISSDTYSILAQHPNINGVKEASGDFTLISKVIAQCGETLHIWSGSDDHTIPMMALGAKGVISVVSNILPERFSRLCGLCLNSDYTEAAIQYRELSRLCELLFVETNPIPVKAAMHLMGLDSGLLRLPLQQITGANAALLRAALEELKISCLNV